MAIVQDEVDTIEAGGNYVNNSLIVKEYDENGIVLQWLENLGGVSVTKKKFISTQPGFDVFQRTTNTSLDIETQEYTSRIAPKSDNANISYVGKAIIGTNTGSALWQIQEINETVGTIILWADGDSTFDNIWDNRESLTYT